MFVVEDCLNDHDDRSSHCLGQLVGTDGIELEGQVGEHHKPAERGRERENFEYGEALGREDVQFCTEEQTEGGDHKVSESESHAREPVAYVDELVEKHYADCRGEIQCYAHSNSPSRCHHFEP